MSIVKISPSKPIGTVTLPPSKSAAHRALICSALAGGGTVSPIIESDDMMATKGALASILNDEETADCIESGSAVRFLIPVAAALGKEITFVGGGSLMTRPLEEYEKILPAHCVEIETQGGLPFKIKGKLRPGHYDIAGDVSSQYLTGLLLALPLLDGDSAINLTTALQSKPYVDMTLDIMEEYGVFVRETDFGYLVKGHQHYKKRDFTVEGDWSQAAFFMAAGAIGGDVTINNADMNSKQGDKVVCDVMKQFGAIVEQSKNSVRCRHGELLGTVINATDIPDMVPALAVTAAFALGETVITGAQRLRFKESDRLKTVTDNLRLMGVNVTEQPDGLIIEGCPERIHCGELKGCNDHRIVMAFTVAATFAKGESTIDRAESIKKSYPSFFEDYKLLGGNVCHQ